MHNQPKYIPLRASEFFHDGRSARLPVEHTVARGTTAEANQFYKEKDVYLDNYFLTGKIGTLEGDKFPLPLTKEVLLRGQERYNIYCTPCHSRVGDGNGMIVNRGIKRPPSYHEERLKKAPIGHFYDVMTNGFGAMLNYQAQIKPEDRWAIAAYIRVLQVSEDASLSDVPPADRNHIQEPANMPTASPHATDVVPVAPSPTPAQDMNSRPALNNRGNENKTPKKEDKR
ncbi:MAG: quinol:cytochrome c oxidoreductase monoheme cytochrome subunit [Acidobacteriales bacterium]|nr:quinol:cytochrome c oxidoreductase monoheme cytochrome subunit [Terriglobales bacterium]